VETPSSKRIELVVSSAARELGLVASYLVVEDLVNRNASAALDDFRAAVYERLATCYTRGYLKRDPVLAGFRELRRRVGGNAQKLPCSTDSLIRQLRRHGKLASINPIVDVYNCVALETRLTLGAHDLDEIRGEVVLTRAPGGERFQPLGGGPEQELEAGEYCYVDGSGDILCRLDYKQADKTRVTSETTRALFILQGNPNTTAASIELARARLAELLRKYCTGGGEDDDRSE
jgi:DNA/RNA-binding domain of Phe-tRNA-synthetase-like protein